ncbi:hypothetical protein HDV03_003538 [Kappamyces sp. JEL0829]|nr:hypothetical protein HDV03_003538 [Kappamyces sp. JEL0829]
MKIDILVYENCDELDFVGPFEVLQNAVSLGAPFELALVSLDPCDTVTASHGLAFKVDATFDPLSPRDLLIVPGGSWRAGKADPTIKGAFREKERGFILAQLQRAWQASPQLKIAAVCTGSLLVAHAGLITRGQTATTHHSCIQDMADLGVSVVQTKRVVQSSERVWTAGGVTSGIDLALFLVEQLSSAQIRSQVEDGLEYQMRTDGFAA